MSPVILTAAGVVHDADNGCAALRAKPIRVPVTPLQIHVYKLGPCRACFPDPRVLAAVMAA